MTLRIASLMAADLDPFYLTLATYLEGQGLGPVEVDLDPDWQTRQGRLLAGESQLGHVCGTHLVADLDSVAPSLQPLAVMVRSGERYAGAGCYWGDVVVRDDSPYQTWDDLRGCRWVVNEPTSHSGHNLPCHQLAQQGEGADFFGSIQESGAHLKSLDLVRTGEADATCLDSTVLELALHRRPDSGTGLRILTSLGPSPSPPLVTHRSMDSATRMRVLAALTRMPAEPEAKQLLGDYLLDGFRMVDAETYAPVRDMLKSGAAVSLAPGET